MTTQNALYKTCFNHNDVLLDYWYDQTLEQSDENEIIDFDNIKGRHIFGQAYLNWLNDELYYYYDRQCIYEALLDCIIYNEAK